MFLSRRPTDVYYIFFFDELGKRHKVSTRCKLKSDALRFLQQFNQVEHERRIKLQRVSLTQFSEDYLNYSRTVLAAKSQESAGTSLREFIRIVGDIPLHRVGVREIESFLAVKMSESSDRTARAYFVTLASAFETAKRWNCVPSNPFRQVEKPKLRELHPAHFTKSEFQSLMQVVHVRNSDSFTTKSKKNRVVPMSEQVWQMLARRNEQAVSELVFHREMKRLTKDYVSKRFKRYVRCAGVNPKLHFHSLRHTFATWLVQDGVSLYEVQKLLGHGSIAVTQVYSHLQPEKLHAAVNRISLN